MRGQEEEQHPGSSQLKKGISGCAKTLTVRGRVDALVSKTVGLRPRTNNHTQFHTGLFACHETTLLENFSTHLIQPVISNAACSYYAQETRSRLSRSISFPHTTPAPPGHLCPVFFAETKYLPAGLAAWCITTALAAYTDECFSASGST